MASIRSSAAARAEAATGTAAAGGPTPITTTRPSRRSTRRTFPSIRSTTPPDRWQNPDGCDNGNNIPPMTSMSYHPGGVNAAFADGSVHFIKSSINSWNWMSITRVTNAAGTPCVNPDRRHSRASGSRSRPSTAAKCSAPTSIDSRPSRKCARAGRLRPRPAHVVCRSNLPARIKSANDSRVWRGVGQAFQPDGRAPMANTRQAGKPDLRNSSPPSRSALLTSERGCDGPSVPCAASRSAPAACGTRIHPFDGLTGHGPIGRCGVGSRGRCEATLCPQLGASRVALEAFRLVIGRGGGARALGGDRGTSRSRTRRRSRYCSGCESSRFPASGPSPGFPGRRHGPCARGYGSRCIACS